MVIGVQWNAAKITTSQRSTFLHLLLGAVVTWLAHRIEIVLVEEQFLVASMRLTMIDDSCRRYLAELRAQRTQRMLA